MAITDNSALKTLRGNPHAEAAAFVDDAALPAAAIHETLLAVAFELRAASSIAVLDQDRAEVRERLCRDGDEQGAAGLGTRVGNSQVATVHEPGARGSLVERP